MTTEKPEDPGQRTSQWEVLMRKFSEAHKEKCKAVIVDIPRASRSVKRFPTGSQYDGTWDALGMSGYGVYTFPDGVIYKGQFQDGVFEGAGELVWPSGAVLKGRWRNGLMTERTLVFADGLQYSENDWEYCRMPDRRFSIEYKKGLQPAGRSYLTADQPTRDIPPGYYDTGDGFYDPKTKIVYSATDSTSIIRSPSVREQKWIVENCRMSQDLPLGPRQDLYEEWSEPQSRLDPETTPASPHAAPRTPVEDDHDVVLRFKTSSYKYPSESSSSSEPDISELDLE